MKTKANRIFTVLLRLLALAATIVAVVVMVTSHESAQVLNLTFTAKYSNDPVFKYVCTSHFLIFLLFFFFLVIKRLLIWYRYFVIAEAIAGGYTLLVLLLSSKILLWRFTIFLDAVKKQFNSIFLFRTSG